MKKYIYIVFLIAGGFSTYGQNFDLEEAPSLLGGINQRSNVSFNLNGDKIAKNKKYFNSLGKGVQGLNWDVLTGKVWASQTLYDRHGRAALQTLSAPVNGGLTYSNDFITNNAGVSYNIVDFDLGGTVENPNPIGTVSELGSFYSNLNTFDPYQDVTSYPFARVIYSKLNPGSGRKIIGGNKANGEWKQAYSFTMPVGTELSCPGAYGPNYNNETRASKTVFRDVHGEDIVYFKDSDGKILGGARSGEDNHPICYTDIFVGPQGYVDIHIPKLVGQFTVDNPDLGLSGNLKVYNLITENLVTTITNANTSVNVPDGFYRIAVSNPLTYGEALNDPSASATPIQINHRVNYYDYGLNEFDKVGNLLRAEQPLAGWLENSFSYNSIGQVVEASSADQGISQFLYRKDGQLRFSQNGVQATQGVFSYTNYDDIGRPIESGVAVEKTGLLYFSNLSNFVDDPDVLNNHDKKEVQKTVYDITDPGLYTLLTTKGCNLVTDDYTQTFVAGNVVKTSTEFPSTSTTWYSYDIQGRVKWTVQKINGMSCYKTIDYSYDPATGLVSKVDFQKHDASERFVHKYSYNEAGHIIMASTSRDGMNFDEQASYYYKESGELARTVLAQDLQGIDYVYNLDGQLKAINHPSLNSSNDPGNDGNGNGIPADVFGIAIDYYNGDYARTGTPTPVAQQNLNGVDQFNGSIKGLRYKTSGFSSASGDFQTYMYQYDKNDWLKSATYGSGGLTNNSGAYNVTFTPDTNNDYNISGLNYDSNGNIQNLKRNGYTDSNGDNSMDDFSYSYEGNRLQTVNDTGDNTDPNRYDDLKDQDSNGAPNYIYNAMGQLITDVAEKVIYEYNTSGLVARIGTFGNNGSGQDNIFYTQDFSSATSTELGYWTQTSGSESINYQGTYIPYSGSSSCALLEGTYSKSIKFEIANNAIASRDFNVIPNVEHTLELDVIVDQWGSAQSPGGYTIEIYNISSTPGGPQIPIASVSFNTALNYIIDLSGAECSKFYDQHETLSFTPNGGTVSFKLKKHSSSGQEPVYLDNITLAAETIPVMDIAYNDHGHRVEKKVYSQTNGDTYFTYYVRDVAGTVMGIYNRTQTSAPSLPTAQPVDPTLSELPIYGAGRIGICKVSQYGVGPGTSDTYHYEIIDHLGNVRAVIGKSSNGTPYVVARTDYYPFGMAMPNRNMEGNYRYKYQGQEKDSETGMEAFGLRLWDSRIGRWLTIDPYYQYASPYLGMGNNPISQVDPDGGSSCPDPPCNDIPFGATPLIGEGGFVADPDYPGTSGVQVMAAVPIRAAVKTAGATVLVPIPPPSGIPTWEIIRNTPKTPPAKAPVAWGAIATRVTVGGLLLTAVSDEPPSEWEKFLDQGDVDGDWWGEIRASYDIVDDIKKRNNSSGYYIHYTTLESAFAIMASKKINPNSSNKVYVTKALMSPMEAFGILFQSQESHKGRGNAAVIIKLHTYQEAMLFSNKGDTFELFFEGTLKPAKIIYGGPNPFRGASW